jgi:hypothetical protein
MAGCLEHDVDLAAALGRATAYAYWHLECAVSAVAV